MQQPKLIWFAIAFSTVIYAAVAWQIAGVPEQTFEASVRESLVIPLYAVALTVFIAAHIVPSLVRKSNAQQGFMVALAMFEACAILGLVAAFAVKDFRLYIAPWILSLIGLAREWPSGEP